MKSRSNIKYYKIHSPLRNDFFLLCDAGESIKSTGFHLDKYHMENGVKYWDIEGPNWRKRYSVDHSSGIEEVSIKWLKLNGCPLYDGN